MVLSLGSGFYKHSLRNHIIEIDRWDNLHLFRWSSRNRKVSRFGSGSESNKFSIQLSFATLSDNAEGNGEINKNKFLM